MMKYKILIQIAVFTVFLALMVLILAGYKPRSEAESLDSFEPDGIEMRYVAFNQNNQKSLEITCAESKKQTEDKTLMRNIKAIIFKKGKMDRDIHVSGDEGFISNSTNHIFIDKNARITSEDIQITSQNFTVKSKNQVTTDHQVHYQAKGLEGIARKGLEFFIKTNVVKLFNTRGTFQKNDRSVEYETDEIWIIDRKKMIIFDKNTEIKDEESVLKSDQLSLQFDEDFNIIRKLKSFDKSYFYHADRQENHTLEIDSHMLEANYTPIGQLRRTVALGDVTISLVDPQNRTVITSDRVISKYNPGTGQISDMKIFPPAVVKNQGKSKFEITADRIDLRFKKGELARGSAKRKCQFKIEDYAGRSDRVVYNLDKSEIHLLGEESTIKKEKNTFISKNFTINTQNDTLTSSLGIKSIINPENSNALFSTDSIFVNAKKIDIFDRENRVLYRDDVRLQQNQTILNTDQLEVRGENHLRSKGNTHLVFKNQEGIITIMGESVEFNPKERTITIQDKAVVRSENRMLKGKLIRILFDEDNQVDRIWGEKEIQFTQEKITGSAEKVNWDFKKELMHFSDSAQIKTADGGSTRGKELMLDLKTSKITVLSEDSKRSETVIE